MIFFHFRGKKDLAEKAAEKADVKIEQVGATGLMLKAQSLTGRLQYWDEYWKVEKEINQGGGRR